jgi:NAD(P)-dependent dehydrogenase (short-subunit alcohol dehydrogenase family)
MAYISPLAAPHFVATKSEAEIAKRLRDDEALLNAGKPCSWVAWHLEGYDTAKARGIAEHLVSVSGLSHGIKSLIYENLRRKIRRSLEDGGGFKSTTETASRVDTAIDLLTASELRTTLKVIARLQKAAVIQQDTPAEAISSWLEQQLAPESPENTRIEMPTTPNIPRPPPVPRKRLCYICRITVTSPYPSQPSMCIPCGAFNSSSSLLSTPLKLSLPPTFTALVTGARLNLGFHTVLRLLRCGARVIATTRYTRDAVARYLAENDSPEWRDRLRIVGADFRSASDAFALVHEAKRCLRSWATDEDQKLRLLVNNAAQTLTDSVKKEERAIHRESILCNDPASGLLLGKGAYVARVRGGATSGLLQAPSEGTGLEIGSNNSGSAEHTKHDATEEIEPYSKSSWVQSMFEIPYEDIMSAHAVNTFVPLILCRELLPLMGWTEPASSPASAKPQGYIINVSSREGIFEDRVRSTAKGGKHVHTNMSKAALNMITETEAASAWKSRRVAMNTVDPGYMSAAPEYEQAFDGIRPIGWEDGAGRVLWPVAISEAEGEIVWGRFLKHYGAVEVDTSVGRG